MTVIHDGQIEAAAVDMPGAVGCRMRCLIGQADGAPHFTMRQFEVAPGGHTPKHTHPYEHEVYVLEGQGMVLKGDAEHALAAGTAVYVPASELHQFRNTGPGTLRFLCLIPHPLGDMTGLCAAACACG